MFSRSRDGRRRREYGLFTLVSTLVTFVPLVTVSLPIAGLSAPGAFCDAWVLAAFLLFIVPGQAVTVRRLHDVGWSGWWSLATFVPFFGLYVQVYLCCTEAELGENAFGPDPRRIATTRARAVVG